MTQQSDTSRVLFVCGGNKWTFTTTTVLTHISISHAGYGYQIIVCICMNNDTPKYEAMTVYLFQDPVSVPESVCAVDGPGSNYSTSCNSDNYDSVQSKLETTVMFSLSSNAINIWPLKRGLPFTVAPAQELFSDVTSFMMHVVRCNRTAEKTLGCNLYKTYDDRFIHRCMLELLNFDIIYVHYIWHILLSHFENL